MRILGLLILVLDVFAIGYVVLHFFINFWLLGISLKRISRDLKNEQVRPAIATAKRKFLPRITLLVPAYNEEVTIVESIRSLLRLSYPSFEIIICNDGSKDQTVEVLRRSFHFVRTEIDHSEHLTTAQVRAVYEARGALPAGLERLVLIDKENGGKADALNAAINVARGDYVTSMDADSLLIPEALLMAARIIVEDEHDIVAIGAQVGISNGSRVEDGRVVEMRMPKNWIARFQIVEYMRSFAQGRVAFAALDALLVLSGVFSLIRRDMVLAVGGFLTKGLRTKIGLEYCGAGAHTVCEDMEIVVRLHRYLLDKRLPGKIRMLPFPTAWTECPERLRDLGKQRARWYRGLIEVLMYHRAIIFRKRFGVIGLFAMPYQLFFEALAPVVEFLGLLVLLATGTLGLLSPRSVSSFLVLALAANVCLSTLSVLLCIRTERSTAVDVGGLALFPYARLQDAALLFVTAFLSNFGYRQYLVVSQLRGLWDFLKGKKEWDKFARKGFAAVQT